MGADATKANPVQGTAVDATKAPQPIFNETVMRNLLENTNTHGLSKNWFYAEMLQIMGKVRDANETDSWLQENWVKMKGAVGKNGDKEKAVIDWFNRIFWFPYRIFGDKSIQWNAAQEAVLGQLLERYSDQGSAVDEKKLKQAFVGGSFNKEKFDKVMRSVKPNSFPGSTFNRNERSPSKNIKQPDQKKLQKQDNIMTDDGVPIDEWTLSTAREHYDNCLTAGEGKTRFCTRVAARYQELQDEQFDFEFWALVLGGGLCGLLFLFAFWWWWSGRLSSRGRGRGGRRGARKYRGGYSP